MNHIFRSIWSEALNTWVAVSEITMAKGKRSKSCVLNAAELAENDSESGNFAKRNKRLRLKPLFVALACCYGLSAQANPTGAQIVSGSASINQNGNLLTVTNTPNAIINWQGFSIGVGQTTNFVQQSISSSVLNRVIGADPSSLLGTLTSNGRVFLVNPAGIFVGQGARIDVPGFVASTLNLSNSNFLSGNLNFNQTPNAGAIQNNGTITTPEGGSVYLIAPQVENYGVINTPKGETILAAGNTVQLVDTGNPGVTVQITGSSNTATNLGQILADSGQIGVVGAVVKNSGTLNASSVVSQGGRVFLRATNRVEAGGTISAQGVSGGNISVLADMQNGTVNVTGTLDASAPLAPHFEKGGLGGISSANGGFIETSAAHVQIADTAHITTAAANGKNGTWLIDPTPIKDFTIAATGGDISGATLGSELNGGNVIILNSSGATGGAGNINVNDVVSWSANQLTLNAQNNININAVMNGSGTASLSLLYGQSSAGGGTSTYNVNAAVNLPAGPNFSTQLGSTGPLINYTVITSLGVASDATTAPVTATLQGMAATSNLIGNYNYVLGSNIDATATSQGAWYSAGGFTPIGNSTKNFTGIFDGLNHTISGLTINLPNASNVGLFGFTSSTSAIKNVGLVGGGVVGGSGYAYVGGLVGTNYGSISNSYNTGSVSGTGSRIGGLVGQNGASNGSIITESPTISNSYATGNVNSSAGFNSASEAGGLAGRNYGTINNSYATGNVSAGANLLGGLVGFNVGGAIANSYATGNVIGTGHNEVGGLTGGNLTHAGSTATVSNSYATGNVNGANSVGGLVGNNSGSISNTYASTGNVTGANHVGGLVGFNQFGSISNSYATDNVSGSGGNVGGLVGESDAAISNSYATGSVSGAGDFVGGLVGNDWGPISNSYATGNVSGPGYIGGLSGGLYGGNTISNSYATGNVNGNPISIGTIIGTLNSGTLTNVLSILISGNPVTWTGGGDGVTWTDSANWGGTLPTLFDTAVIGAASINIPINVMAYNVTAGTGSALNFTGTRVSSLAIGTPGTITLGASANDVTLTYNTSGKLNLPSASTLSVNGASYNVINNLGTATDNSTTGIYTLQGMAFSGDTSMLSQNYVLGLDINASATSGWNSGAGFTPIGNGFTATPFTGNFDGLGHTISGLTINTSISGGVGLFGSSHSAIRNVGLIGANVHGSNSVGALAGRNYGQISNSYASSGSVSASANWVGGLVGYNNPGGTINTSYAANVSVSGGNAGGLVGGNNGATISNSYATGSVSASGNAVGGLVGDNVYNGTISNSYATGNVTGTSSYRVGGLVGYNNGARISNSYATGNVHGGSSVGGLVGDNNGAISNSYASTGSVTGTGAVGGLVGKNDTTGTISNTYATGNVTGTGYYVGGLVGVNYGTISSSYATGNVHGATAVGGLVGRNGGTISSSYVSSGSVSVSGSQVGGLVGNNNGTITNSYYDVTNVTLNGGHEVTLDGLYNDGGTGQFHDWISNSLTPLVIGNYSTYLLPASGNSYTVNGVQGMKDLLAFAGNTGYTFTLGGSIDLASAPGLNIPYFAGTVFDGGSGSGFTITGLTLNLPNEYLGLFGKVASGSTIQNVAMLGGSVSGANRVGGLVGANYGTVSNSYTTGNVSGGSYAGGLVGQNDGTISSSYATGNVTGTVITIGGLVGRNSGTISNSYATGNVSGGGSGAIGGLVGYNTGAISNSYASTGTVTGSGSSDIGGLVGYNTSGTISNTYATGNVNGSSYVGGLVGYNRNNGTISNSYATGNVHGMGTVSGGLAGKNDTTGTISNTYATGNVNGVTTVGGLVGNNSGTISNSYANTGTVSGTTNSGILVGAGSGGLTNVVSTVIPGNTVTWTGGGDGVTWTDSANWAGGTGVPTIFDTAVIGVTASINIPINAMVYNVTSTAGSALNFTGTTVNSLAIGSPSATALNSSITLASNATLTDYGNLSLNAAVSGAAYNLTLLSKGAISEAGSGAITTTGTLTTSSVGGTSLTGANAVSGFNATNTTSGNISLTNTASTLTVGGISNAAGNLTLNTTGTVTQTAPINVAGLELLGTGGTYTLTNAGNAITTVAGNTGSVNLLDSTALTVGTVNSTVGLTTGTVNAGFFTGGNVTLSSATGDINVNALIKTGYYQAGGSAGNAGDVSLTATAGNIVLGVTGTAIDASIGADGSGTTTGNGGAISLTASGGISGAASNLISSVTKYQYGSTGSPGGIVTLTATGGDINIGNINTSTFQNDLGGTIGNGGTVTVTASGSVTVGSIITKAIGGLFINTGATTTILNGGNVSLTASNGNVTVNGAVDAGAYDGSYVISYGGSIGQGGSITLNSAGLISQGTSAPISTTGTGTLTTSSVGGTNLSSSTNAVPSFNATNMGSGDISLTNSASTLMVTGISNTAANGNIALDSAGTLTLSAPVTAGTGNIGLTAYNINLGSTAATTVTGGAVTLTANQTGGTISQFAGGTVTATNNLSIVADNISFGGITSTVLGGNTTSGGNVNIVPYTSGRAIEIGGATANPNALSITQADDLAAINPGRSNIIGGAITIGNNNSGTITFTGNFTSPGGMYPNLYGTTVTQSANTTISGGLQIGASGAITLTEPTNQIDSLGFTFTSPSAVSVVTSVPSLTLMGTVSAGTGGLSVNNIYAGGSILVKSTTTSGGAVNLTAAGAITESGPGLINTTGTLTTSSVGGTILNGANAVGGFSATNTGSGDISLTTTAATLTVAGIGQVGGGAVSISNTGILTTSGGITTDGGNVTLNASGALNINSSINAGPGAGTGTVTLRADSLSSCLSTGGTCSTVTFGSTSYVVTAATTNIYYDPTNYTSPTTFSTLNVPGTLNAFMLLNDVTQLQAVNNNLAGSYALGTNIDASATSGWTSGYGGSGFTTLGTHNSGFTGTFDGLNHIITNLTINTPTASYVGLFGETETGSIIKNVGLINASISGKGYVGSLVGANSGSISNSYATGSINGTSSFSDVGGLAGANYGSISNSYSTVNVSGSSGVVGGLVGFNYKFGTVSNSYATGSVSVTGSYVGGLVGINNNSFGGMVINSYATGKVTGNNYVGGLVGYNTGGNISNTYAVGSVSGSSYVGGLVGKNYSGSISNNFYETNANWTGIGGAGVGKGNGTADVVGTVFGMSAADLQNSANFTGSTIANGYNANQNWSFTATPGGSGWVIVNADGSLNVLGIPGGGTFPMLVSEYSQTITNAHQLQLMAMAPGASYTLGANINASGTSGGDVWGSSTFIPIGTSVAPFAGTFDGFGHTINGLTINLSGSDNIGLFGYTSTNSVIQNVGLIGGSVSGNTSVGGLVGNNFAAISNSYFSGSVTGGGYHVGGLVGANNGGSINNSYTTGSVTGTGGGNIGNIGGLVGANSAPISNSYSTANVSGNHFVGGLVGHNYGTVTVSNSYATGSVSGINDRVGGLVGENDGTISNSYATGRVSGANAVGGLVGQNYGTASGTASISSSYATGNVTGTGNNVGGLVGYNYAGGTVGNSTASISNSYATGSVSGTGTNVGGLVGYNFGGGSIGIGNAANISNSYATGHVSGLSNVGGLVGNLSGSYYGTASISNSYATGSVSGNSYVGGLVGNNASIAYYGGTISSSYATGNVSATGSVTGNSYIGGLVGSSNGSISNSYATGSVSFTGSVSGSSYVGGLVGYNYGGTVSNTYATGSVSATGSALSSNVGGLAGANRGGISNSYAMGSVSATGSSYLGGLVGYNNGDAGATVTHGFYNSINSAGIGHDSGISPAVATGLTTANMMNASSFAGGLNFTPTPGATGNNWVIVNADGTLQTNSSSSGGATLPMLASEYSTTIVNAHQLQLMEMAPGASYTLGANINASATAGSVNDVWSGSTFVPIGTSSGNQFNGTFDGLGHTISNLTINLSGSTNVGLFGYTGTSSVIQNVGLVGGSVNGYTVIGELVGYNSGSISNAYATGSVTGNAGNSYDVGGLVGHNFGSITAAYATGNISGDHYVGGLVGGNDSAANITNSYASGNATGQDGTGGLVGLNSGGSITNAYAIGNVSGGSGDAGGLVGTNTGGTVSNAYSSGSVSGTGNVGGLVGNNNGTVTTSYWDITTSGQGSSAGGTALTTTTSALTQSSYSGWDFGSTWYMVNGYTRPFLQMEWGNTITNAHQLQLMGMNLAANYTLANSLDLAAELANPSGMWGTQSGSVLTGITSGFAPIGNSSTPFTGTFDGLGHTISNLTINLPTTSYVGLFGYAGTGAVIQDMGLLGGSVSGNSYTGELVGRSFGTVSNSYATGSVSGAGIVGGLVAQNDGTVSNSYATDSVSGTGVYIGGLVGVNNGGVISNSYAIGSVSGSSSVGGLVGLNQSGGTVSNSFYNSDVNPTLTGIGGATDVGGTVWGMSTAAMQNSANFTSSQAGTQPNNYHDGNGGVNPGWVFTSTPGAAGWVIVNADGSLNANGSPGGGTLPMLASEYSTTISNAHQLQLMAMNLGASYTLEANVNASGTAGGDVWGSAGFVPVGYNGHNFTGTFDGLGHTISGLTISQPTSTSGVGLFGYGSGTIQNVGLVNANVTGNSLVGGLVGNNFGTVSNSYFTGSVNGNNYVGGLLGYNSGTVNNSYSTASVNATGSVSGNNYVGGLVGLNFGGTISNSYATGNVMASGNVSVGTLSGSNYIGGLVGGANGGLITNSYATGNVTSTGNVAGGSYVGGLVGSNSGTVSYSFASGNVTATGSVGSTGGMPPVGGLAGINTGVITNSYATGNVTGTVTGITGGITTSNQVGGLVGDNNGTISNSYATGNVTATGMVGVSNYGGGLAGTNEGSISNSYATGAVTATVGDYNYVGGLVGYNQATGTVTHGYWNSDANSLGIGSDSNSQTTTGLSIASMHSASNFSFTFTSQAGGAGWVIVDADGTLNNAGSATGATLPMLASEYSTTINNAHQLQLMAMNIGESYTLGTNIDASATAGSVNDVWSGSTFVPIGYTTTTSGSTPTNGFTGSFNGQSHTISNLTINSAAYCVGLFGCTGATAVIQNVGLLGGTVSGSFGSTGLMGVGALVGLNQGTISNSYATGSVSGSVSVGGLVGYNYSGGTVTNSYATGSVTGSSMNVGGLVGLNNISATVSYSYATGNVINTGANYVGGLIGANNGTISNSYAKGNVSGAEDVGGLAGYNSYISGFNGVVSDSYATGNVSGTQNVGGLAGSNTWIVSNSYATGNVSGAGKNVGGLVGYGNAGSINSSYATGAVTGLYDVGGLMGYGNNNGTITNSYATGNVTGATSGLNGNAGGLIGYNNGTISNSYATGNVSGGNYSIGGLAGYNDSGSTISNSYATGNVTGIISGTHSVGGLVGYSRGTITNSYATGNVNGLTDVGGLLGTNDGGTVSVTYSDGLVSGTASVGGLVGNNVNAGSVSGSFWNSTVNTVAYDGNGSAEGIGGTSASQTGATPLTTTEMENASYFSSFTFTSSPGASGNNWVIVNPNGTLATGSNTQGATLPMLASEYSTTIANAHQLQLMEMNLGANYTLGANVNASGTGNGGDVWGSAGFVPIGNLGNQFTGTFDGLGHAISGLTISMPTRDFVGLFGYTGVTSVISEVGLVGGSVAGASYVGALVGANGTVPSNFGGVISNSYATGSVNGTGSNIGGLVGINLGTISNNYATDGVSGSSSSQNVGGMVGNNYSPGAISNSYATGSVSGLGYWVGGLVGVNNGGTVSNSYSTGSVSGTNGQVGGLVGFQNGGSITNSFWDTTTSGLSTSAGGSPLNATQMQTASNFAGFNFTSTPGASGNNWVIVNADGTLQTNASATAGATFPMLASEYSTTINNSHQLQLMEMNLSGNYKLGANVDASGTGNGTDVWATTFVPLGTSPLMPFTGTFDGQGHTISNLNINLPSTNVVGLFGAVGNINSGTVSNVGLLNPAITGNLYVGGLVGFNIHGTISNSYVEGGTVSGTTYVGGLVGYNDVLTFYPGFINSSYTSGGSVIGNTNVGGLAGYNGSLGTITNAYSTFYVNGTGTSNNLVGGLVEANAGSINNTYSTGYVTSTGANVGGLVGINNGGGTVNHSFWNKDTSGQSTDGSGSSATGLTTTDILILSTNYTTAVTNWDFTNTWGIVAGASTPYFLWRFPVAPQVVSGSLAGNTGGSTIQTVANGNLLTTSFTGADGSYLQMLDSNTVSNGSALLTYLVGGYTNNTASAAVRLSDGNNLTGVNLTQNMLTVSSNSSAPVSNSILAMAKGSLSSNDIPYSVDGSNNLTVSSTSNGTGVGFQTDLIPNTSSYTNYSLDGNVTTTNASQTWNGLVTMTTSNAVLSAITSGNININNTVNAAVSAAGGTVNFGTGASLTGSILAAQTVSFGTNGSVTGNVTAATLDYSSYATSISASVTAAYTGTITGVTGTFSGVSAINANTANSNTLNASGDTWTITAPQSGSLANGSLSFTGMSTLNDTSGGTLIASGDIWTITGSQTGSLANGGVSFSGMNTLNDTSGGTLIASGDTWTVTGSQTGSLMYGGVNFSGMNTLNDTSGGTLIASGDTWTITAPQSGSLMYGGVSFSGMNTLNDTSGSGTLIATNDTWTITSPQAGSLQNGGVSFSGMNSFNDTSGSGTLIATNDNWTITSSQAGNLQNGGVSFTGMSTLNDTGTGTLTVSRDANITLTNSSLAVNGESTLNLSGFGSAVLTGGASADIINASAFSGVVTINDISGGDTLIGNGLNTTLIGSGQIYTLDNTTQNKGSSSTTGTTWTGVGNLTDTGAGVFNMGTGGSVAGTITATGGTLNYSTYGSAISATVTGTNAGTITGVGGTYSGVSTITGNSAYSNTMGGSGQTYVLTNGTADAGSSNSVNWTNFKNISDATGTVNFQASGSVTGSVTAATLDDSTYGSAVTVGLAGAGAGTITGVAGTFSGVSAINANSANSNTMGGTGVTYVLTNGTPNAGSADGVTWTNFKNINDTTGTVNFGTTGTLGGNVTAATLNDTTYTGAVTVGLTGTGAGTITGVAGTFSGVSAINANSANSNTWAAPARPTCWTPRHAEQGSADA